jgi:hypothetical protein
MPSADPEVSFDEAGGALNVDPMLLRAIAQVESGGAKDPDRAVSSAGALGRMQVMPPNLQRYNVSDPTNPRENIHAGAAVFDEALTAANGNVPLALRIYQGGQDQSKWGPNNAAYPGKVAAAYQALSKASPAAGSAPPASTAPDATDAFLSGSAGGGGPKAAPSAPDATDAFLAGKEDIAPKTEAPNAITPNDISGEGRDAYGAPLGPLGPAAPREPPPTIGSLRNAMAPTPGYVSMSPLPFALKETYPGSGVADPNSGLAGMKPDLGPLRGIGTGLLDLLEGPSTGTVTPEARNLLAMAAMGGKLTPSVARGTGAAIRDTAELGAPASRLYDPSVPPRTAAEGNLLADHPRPTDLPPQNRMAAPPAATPATTTPAPQSVGAAASGAVDMSPAEVQAYRSTGEGQKLLESQQPGKADTTAYVPGVSASTAEIEQTVNAARDAKTANIAHPGASQAAKETADANNAARQRYVETTIKSPIDILNAKDARAAQAETDLAATWKNKTEADAQPVIDAANEIKASPDGRRPVVRSAVDAVTNELYDADGKLITDPEQLYGVRKHIDDLLSKEAGATDPKSIRAASNLQQLKTALDGVIEPAAPGFKQYLKNFADASRPIDEMEVLQGHQNKLYDTQGRMQLSRVQGMMRNIVDSRAAPGINPYKSISDETMQRLWNVRDDLRRSASAQELARTPGSDTGQNLFDMAKQGLAAGGNLVAHGVAHAVAPIAGPIILNAVKGGISNRLAAGAQRKGLAAALHNINPNRLVTPQD